jgi:DNA-binding MltR family transcriptional regulator
MLRYIPKDYDAVFAELEDASDRAVILVAASLLDHALAETIMTRLREPPTNEGWEELFKDGGPLHTFSQKIMIAYFLKIVGPLARRDLDLIRKIRNAAAHDMNPVSFDGSDQIANRTRELQMGNDNTRKLDLRTQFLVATKFYVANLMLRAGDSSAEIAEAFKSLAPYLDR